VGVDGLREITRGRPVVILTATETEAEALVAYLAGVEQVEVATKVVVQGDLPEAGPVVLGITGCDKANTAHLLGCLLQVMTPAPALVVQVGIAGAFPSRAGSPGPQIGDVVLATMEAYSDTGSSSPEGWLSAAALGLPIASPHGEELGGVFPVDADLVDAAAKAITRHDWPEEPPAVHLGPCVTSSRVTGLQAEAAEIEARWGALAESMEGAAAAHVCALYGVPFLEVRGVSNLVGDRDRATWDVETAATVAACAATVAVKALYRRPAGSPVAPAPGAGPQDGRS
jgi:futalosine hydrolase